MPVGGASRGYGLHEFTDLEGWSGTSMTDGRLEVAGAAWGTGARCVVPRLCVAFVKKMYLVEQVPPKFSQSCHA